MGEIWKALNIVDYPLKIVKQSLNMFVIRRVATQIPKSKILSIVHALWISKLRYGLQLCSKVRLCEEDPKPAYMNELQLTQNRLLRALNNTKVKDKVSTREMLDKFELLSVNQLAAQIKLLEVWKAVNVPGYAIVLEPYNQTRPSNTHDLRTQANRIFNDSAKLKIAEQSFSIDAGKVWNRAPESVTKAPTLYMAKRAIRTLVKSFPV